MFRTFTLGVIISLLSGCSTYATSRYAINADNVTSLREQNTRPLGVGNFTSTDVGQREIMCRGVGPIKTPDGETFADFVRKGLVDELKIAGVFSGNAPITLTGNLNRVEFSSTSGSWDLSLTVNSSNGKSMTVNEKYVFSTSFYGETACNQTAQALMPAVQNLIGKVVLSTDFKALVN